eukprot:311749-Amphidinium_carterae.1
MSHHGGEFLSIHCSPAEMPNFALWTPREGLDSDPSVCPIKRFPGARQLAKDLGVLLPLLCLLRARATDGT